MIWHSSTAEEVLNELEVDSNVGLANGIVDERLVTYGQNVISTLERPKFINRFLAQFKNKTVIFLMAIAVISCIVSLMYNEFNFYSPLLIIAIVGINAAISAYHIHNCDNMLDSIKLITNPSVNVLREGTVKSVNSAQLVPGDIILLEAGDYIPADARLIQATEFRCNEIAITGVEVPVEKDHLAVYEDITPIEKRNNLVFSGCSVVHGTAKAVVVSTGFDTEIGRNASIIEQTGQKRLPLENQLESIGKIVNLAVFIVCAFIFALGMIQNFSSETFATMTLKMLINSVALAVAAIPEGLPAITMIVIAIGTHRILQDKIIVKDPDAAELLGKTDVICCDKTGVFTHNKMVLNRIFDGKRIIDLTQEQPDEQAQILLQLATACSTLGNDSTENAIENACLEYNSMSKTDVDALFPHIAEIPFDSDRKTMTVITMINERPFAIVKGAAETVIPNCVGCNSEEILKVNEALADEALRNVCIAMRPLDSIPANPIAEEIEHNLTFAALICLSDPPRGGVVDDIATCDAAGIKTVMITGDNLITAKTVARRIGILKDDTLAISGAELNEMSDEELAANIHKYSVFARVSSNDKLRIVKAWQQNKKVITITGDSIQDADALALADVGCAIGKYGADVAKGNADIIIQDNRFDSIVHAIKESRGLFSNIKKSVFYLFSCNLAEIIAVLFGMILFKTTPLAAVQLLWINLLTDCAPAISLSMESAENNIMKTKPLSSIGRIFDKKSIIIVILQSIFMSVTTLIAFKIGFGFTDSATAMTMAFATLGFTQIFHCLNNKFTGSVFNKAIFSNSFMNFALGISLFIIAFLVLTPAGFVFGFNILTVSQLFVTLLLSVLIIPFTEILKLISYAI